MKKIFTSLMSAALVMTLLFGANMVNAQAKVLSLAEEQVYPDPSGYVSGAKDGYDLTWATSPVSNLLGNTSATTKVWGLYNRFDVNDLVTKGAVGMNITKIKCYPYTHSQSPSVMSGLAVAVYFGGSYTNGVFEPGTQVAYKEFAWNNVYAETEVVLDEPVYIDGSQEVWIGAIYTYTNGYVATACDSSSYMPLKGDIISMTANGVTEWYQTKDCVSTSYWPYNWFVQGYLEPGEPPTPPVTDAIIYADFEIGKNGGKVAKTYSDAGFDFFTTWSEAPGGAEDATFSNAQAYEGTLSAHFTFGSDFVVLLGDKTAGHYSIDFNMYLPKDKDGYFNILHAFAGSNSEWATEVYLNSATEGTALKVLGVAYNFEIPFDAWFPIHFDIDLDNDLISATINNVLVHEWQFSLDASKGTRQLSAMDFFPPTSAAVSDFYVDSFVYKDLNAGGVVFESDFEDAKVNDYLAVTYPDFWTTWSQTPGTAEDGKISNEEAASGSQSVKFTYGNDNVFLAGDQTTGHYMVNFNMLVPKDKDAYFNVLHVFAGSNSEWATEIYFNSATEGNALKVQGVAYNFEFPFSTWFPVNIDIDLDNDLISVTVNNVLVHEWQFSLTASKGTRQFAAMDFFPPTSAAVSTFYIDDFVFESAGGSTAPNIGVDVTDITIDIKVDGNASSEVNVSNTGSSIGDYIAWVSYDELIAKGNTGNYALSYCGEPGGGVGYTSSTPTIECGARFTADYYMEFIGTELKQVSYYLNADAADNNKIVFRVYGQGPSTMIPGELLEEVVLKNGQSSFWNTVSLNNPIMLDGQDIWIMAEFTQAAEGTYPIGIDQLSAPYNENGDLYRLNGGTMQSFGGEYGNVCVRGFAEGTPAPAWIYLSGASSGSLKVGESASFNVMFDATSLENRLYQATLKIRTNDTKNPLFEIPVKMNVTTDGIDANNIANVVMYPNPASSEVRISAMATINSIAVYNGVGQLVSVTKVSDNNAVISVEGLNSGIYFVRINTVNGTQVSKLVVK